MTSDQACGECGQRGDPARWHPHIVCMLVKAGVTNPEGYIEATMPLLRQKFPVGEGAAAVSGTKNEED